jgi:MFS family permease
MGATAFSWNFASFTFLRALTGAGIGGEYADYLTVSEIFPLEIRARPP